MALRLLKPRLNRHARVRAKVRGTAACPRLSVYRSLKHIRVQLIDDDKGVTLAAASDMDLKSTKGGAKAVAQAVGKLAAQRARTSGISRVVFDRGGFAYHGRVKALAEGAREGGLEF